eukprot:TRINITY_DN7279_c1_g1_i2.p2 TRINITY_DN7279_c1_g1~~TRINITY_DN7279_c1_g1_i2.p2  ORF type:complete len:133 (-),score=20.94 TRINITY_DN7279_c1_g1_i2:606-1004(-)
MRTFYFVRTIALNSSKMIYESMDSNRYFLRIASLCASIIFRRAMRSFSSADASAVPERSFSTRMALLGDEVADFVLDDGGGELAPKAFCRAWFEGSGEIRCSAALATAAHQKFAKSDDSNSKLMLWPLPYTT